MINGVESRTSVAEDEKRYFAVVNGADKVTVDGQESCFS